VARKKKEAKPKEYTRRQLSHFKRARRRQRIVFIAGIGIIVAIILIVLGGWFASEFYPLHRTMLKVNGVKFNVAYYIDVMKAMRDQDRTLDTASLASNALQNMIQGELIRQGAEKLNITASKDEVTQILKNQGLPDNPGIRGYYQDQLVAYKMQSIYFASKVPTEAAQVHALIMLLESAQLAQEMKAKVASGDNFTTLAGEYSIPGYASGDYGYHPRDILKTQLDSDIPLDYAFSADIGSLSPPLYDANKQKQVGFWLINVVDRPEPGQAAVEALLVSENSTAMWLRDKLVAGSDNLSSLSDQFNQYSLSKEKHGDLGVLNESDNTTYTQAFNSYVFNPDTPTEQWSQPIRETELWTSGAYWLVQVLGREDNRAISQDDRSYLASQAYSDWVSGLSSDPDLDADISPLTEDLRQWAMDRLDKEYPQSQG
jgi:hypothetical protein